MNLKLMEIEYRGKKMEFFVRKKSRSDPKIIKEIFLDDAYERRKTIKSVKGKVVMDLGAYIGDTAIWFSEMGAKMVYCYEPHPAMYEVLVNNLYHHNREGKVRARMVGLSSKGGNREILGWPTQSFGVGKGPWLRPEKHLIRVKMRDSEKEIDRIIRKEGEIGVLKIDIEGYEKGVIEKLRWEQSDKIELMLVECHNDETAKMVWEKLKSMGRRVTEMRKNEKKKYLTVYRSLKRKRVVRRKR